jgi:dolichyl-phosphate beta-glucosyltransferase
MEQKDTIELSIVLACYNAESYLRESVQQLIETMSVTRYNNSYELIFVDDRSMDGTVRVIEDLVLSYQEVRTHLILHERNTGRGRTVTDGLLAARGRIAGFLDIDLETPAHYIPAAALAIERGADVASAVRVYKLLWHSIFRQLMSYAYHGLERFALQLPLKDTEAGFKFFNLERILPVLAQCTDPGWFWDTEIMARSYFSGLKIVELPTLFIKRYDKPSTVRPIHDSIEYLRNLAAFRRVARDLCAGYSNGSWGTTPEAGRTLSGAPSAVGGELDGGSE